jgi:hypothetical protein
MWKKCCSRALPGRFKSFRHNAAAADFFNRRERRDFEEKIDRIMDE